MTKDCKNTCSMQDAASSCSPKDDAASGSAKHRDDGCLSEIFGSCLSDIFAAIVIFALCLYFFSPAPSEEVRRQQGGAGKENKTYPDWHRAGSKAEIVKRIQARLVQELTEAGLDAQNISNIVANAKAHPTRLATWVPEHKRMRLLVLSTNEEAVIARKMVDEYKKAGRFDDETNQIARIGTIAARLVAVVPEIDSVPEIHILKDDSVNACCLPDGTIFVNRGTLKDISDDSMLAAIIAHELGHAAARHGNENLTYILIGSAGDVAFEEWLAGVVPALDSGKGVSLIRLAYGMGSAVGFYLPQSRHQELEADRLGIRYLARAGFDPKAAVRMFQYFEKMEPRKSDALITLLNTHPVNAERVEHAGKVLGEPDLRKMPKTGWGEKLKRRVDAIDLTNIDANALVTNEVATNLPSASQRFKLPLKRKDDTSRSNATGSEN